MAVGARADAGVLVLGMGRSGTSAIAGGFVRAGFWAGNLVLPANAGNPAGYHENAWIVLTNDRVLRALGGSWFDPPEPSVLRTAFGVTTTLRATLDRLIREAGPRPVLVKDPRIGVMMPLWDPILVGRLHPVLAVRHPAEVARSLARRDGTPVRLGLAGWELHMSYLLAALHGRLVTVAPYAAVMADPHQLGRIVALAASHLDSRFADRVDAGAAERVPSSELQHHRSAGPEAEAEFTPRQLELWRLLSGLGVGDVLLDVPPRLRAVTAQARAAVREETRRIAPLAG